MVLLAVTVSALVVSFLLYQTRNTQPMTTAERLESNIARNLAYCAATEGEGTPGYEVCAGASRAMLIRIGDPSVEGIPEAEWTRSYRHCDGIYGENRGAGMVCKSAHAGLLQAYGANDQEPPNPICEQRSGDNRQKYWSCILSRRSCTRMGNCEPDD